MRVMKKSALVGLLFCLFLGCGIAKGQEVIVIANKSVKASDVSAADLKDVFNGDKSSLGDGSHVVPATLKSGPVHEAFLKKYVGKADAAFRAEWRSLVFAGTASMPKTLDSESAMVEYVAATPGAIGYVGKDPGDSVKKLAVK
jgi:ABC-type phosphate transport system substrate-binding protein